VKHDIEGVPGSAAQLLRPEVHEFAEASADAWKRVQAFVTGK